MRKNTLHGMRASLSAMTILAVALGTFGASVMPAFAVEETVTVTINKYIDGTQATAGNANSADFPMSATWNDPTGIGAGTGSYTLGAGNAVPYEAVTSEMDTGADYTTNEVTGGPVVGASCETEQPFSLVGYTYGDTLSEAQGGTPTMTPPAFTGLTSDKYVIVWNHDCSMTDMPSVTIQKYVDGVPATASSTDSSSFPMTATWNDPMGIGAGTGEYTLNGSTTPAYEAETIDFNQGADYATSENTGGDVVGESCATEQPFELVGYTTGNSWSEAQGGTPTTTAPAFTNLMQDKYVIVWNDTCDGDGGTIGGDVEGSEGVLAVTSIESVDTTATADGTYENGWEYLFNITIPTDETGVAMKFSDWTSASSTIPAANNMRISSTQADNGGSPITVVAANTYTVPDLNMVTDLNPAMPGIQVQIKVEVKIPVGTQNGSYSTNYSVRSQ